MDPIHILLIVYMIIILFCGTLLNLIPMVIYSINFKSYESVFILFSLSAINFLNSLIVPHSILINDLKYFQMNKPYCQFYYFHQYFLNSESLLLLALISFERYNKISALNESEIFKSKIKYNSKIATIVSFAIALSFAAFSLLTETFDGETCKSDREYIIICVVFLAFILIIMCFTYMSSYLIVRRRMRQISSIFNDSKIIDHTVRKEDGFSKIETINKTIASNNNTKKSLSINNLNNLISIFVINTGKIKSNSSKFSNLNSNEVKIANKNQMIRKDWKIAQIFFLVSLIHFKIYKERFF